MKVVDLHCDTILEIWNSELRGERLSLRDTEGSGHPLMLDLKKMSAGDYLLQNFALFTDLKMPKDFDGSAASWMTPGISENDPERCWDPWDQFLQLVRIFNEEMSANADLIRPVRSYADIEENIRAGRMSALLTTEEGGFLQGRADRLKEVYDAGVRMMTITWNYDNELGHPNKPMPGFETDFRKYFQFRPGKDDGLTPVGKEIVDAMTSMHIIPDVSHLSDAGFYDVADICRGPFAASHSNARALCGCSRNLTDEMIRIIGGHGGVIGINYAPPFVTEADSEERCVTTCEALARHARHIMNVGGSDVIALGSDFDGISPVGLEIENASQMQKLAAGFERNGFSVSEIEGIFFRNALRMYRDVLK